MKKSWQEKLILGFSGLFLLGGVFVVLFAILKNDNHEVLEITKTKKKRNIINRLLPQKPNRRPANIKENPKNVKSESKKISWKKISNPVKRIETLNKCYESEGACGFSTDDPKSEFFAIGKAIKKELLKIQHQSLENNNQSLTLRNLAIKNLKNPDGHVKEAALHLLSSQEPSTESLDAILESIIAFHDATLIRPAMLELSRYLGKNNGNKIDSALIKAIKNGSPLVSEEIAKNITPFIRNKNYSRYRSLLKSLGLGSLSHQNLKNALADFKRSQKAA